MFAPDGRTLASVGVDIQTRLWDPRRHRFLVAAAGLAVRFSSDGRRFAATDDDGWVVYELAVRDEVRALPGAFEGAEFSPDGSLLAVFGLLALALASVGLYGVMSYSVSQRTREIGLRMALGADRRGVMRLVLGQGLVLVGAGVVLGLGGALASTRAVAALLYGSAFDPVSFVGAPLVLVLIAFLASVPPALRASRVDPIVALREV